MFKQIIKKLNIKTKSSNKPAINPIVIHSSFEMQGLKQKTKEVLKNYENKSDIRKFTSIALSSNQCSQDNDLLNSLKCDKDFIDPFSDNALDKLATNENLLKDLGY